MNPGLTAAKAARVGTFVLIAALAGGCAGPRLYEDWDARPSVPALPMVHVVVAEDELASFCGRYEAQLYGCARRDYRARSCTVYTGPAPHPHVLQHERRHCEGWDHAPGDARIATVQTALGITDLGGQ